jgi:hypothetical protein
MEQPMTDLLTKATALLEAREAATQGECKTFDVDFGGRLIGVQNGKHDIAYCCNKGEPFSYGKLEGGIEKGFEDAAANAHFFTLAVNTACDTIQGYQELLRRIVDLEDVLHPYGKDHTISATRIFSLAVTALYSEGHKSLARELEYIGEALSQTLTEARAALPPA